MENRIKIIITLLLTCYTLQAQSPIYGDRDFISSNGEDTLSYTHDSDSSSKFTPDYYLWIERLKTDSVLASDGTWYQVTDIGGVVDTVNFAHNVDSAKTNFHIVDTGFVSQVYKDGNIEIMADDFLQNYLRLQPSTSSEFGYANGINDTKIRLGGSTTGILILDENNSLGLKYNSDYSSNGLSNDRWIPDVAAVRSIVSDSTGNASSDSSSITYEVDSIRALSGSDISIDSNAIFQEKTTFQRTEQTWDSIAFSSTINVDFTDGSDYKMVVVTGDITINVTDLYGGESVLWIIQDGTGSHTVTKGTGWGDLRGSGTISTDADAISVVQWQKAVGPGTYSKIIHWID